MSSPRYMPINDRGISSSVQWALIIPVVRRVIFAAIQASIYFYGHSAAHDAAASAAEQSSFLNGDIDQAKQTAMRIADQAGLRDCAVSITAESRKIDVDLDARVPIVGPDWLSSVHAHASRLKEE